MSDEDIEQFQIRITKHAGLDGFVLVSGELDDRLMGSRTDLPFRLDDGGPVSRLIRLLQTLLQALFSR